MGRGFTLPDSMRDMVDGSIPEGERGRKKGGREEEREELKATNSHGRCHCGTMY